MVSSVTIVRAPADSAENRVRKWFSSILARVFITKPACQHPSPSFPIAGTQNCPLCGMWRDYIFSPRWKSEYSLLIDDYSKGNLTRSDFVSRVHDALVRANAVFVGEWRKGVRE